VELSEHIGRLGEDGRRLYSRWSVEAWRLCCQGPAAQLWDSLAGSSEPEAALADYLNLLREAVGLQYLCPCSQKDLDPRDPAKAGASFLGVALCDTLPRLLAEAAPASRAALMAKLWNAGEKLRSQPAWLNRYLAVRLLELGSLDDLEPFLSRALSEGLDALPDSPWRPPFARQVIDPTDHDRAFLPGRMHLATPALVCVHDRRRPQRQVAVLLRPGGGSLCLGTTPCLEGEVASFLPSKELHARLFAEPQLPERLDLLATRGGFALFSSPLSQRLWIAEARGT
jgi:hypothetical protein